MANQVLVHVKTTKGTWETTFQKSTRIKDVINCSRMHLWLSKEVKIVLCREESSHVDFDPDRAFVNYNVLDGEVLILKEVWNVRVTTSFFKFLMLNIMKLYCIWCQKLTKLMTKRCGLAKQKNEAFKVKQMGVILKNMFCLMRSHQFFIP